MLWLNGEDLMYCFNLFRLPVQWRSFMTYSKKADASAVGGVAGVETHVAITVCPMGWVNAVDLIQICIRNFVYGVVGVPSELGMRKDRAMPDDEIAVTCMDGFDLVSKVRLINGTLAGGEVEGGRVPGGRSGIMTRFVQECNKRGLPLNAGESVIGDFCGVILGGELDGVRGVLRHSRV